MAHLNVGQKSKTPNQTFTAYTIPTLRNMVTPRKQINQFSCSLACVESLTIDKQQPRTQQNLIDQFHDWCHKGQFHIHPDGRKEPKDGQVSHPAFLLILKSLGLAQSFEVGIGRDFLEKAASQIDNGVFLQTTTHPNGKYGGFHCLRLENVQGDTAYFVEPSQSVPFPIRGLHLDSPEIQHGLVIKCVT